MFCFRFVLKHVFLCCFCFPCTRRRWRERWLPQHVVAPDGRRRGPRVPRGADPHLQHLPDAVDPAPGLADGAAAGADHLLPSHRPRLHGAAQLRTVHRLHRYVSTKKNLNPVLQLGWRYFLNFPHVVSVLELKFMKCACESIFWLFHWLRSN